MPDTDDAGSSPHPPPSPSPSSALERGSGLPAGLGGSAAFRSGSGRRGRKAWPLALGGVGLFLAGTILGGILVLAVALYREPASTPLLPPFSSPVSSPLPFQVKAQGEDSAAGLPPVPSPVPTSSARPVGPRVGWEAPAFAAVGLDQEEHTLAAYRGRTVLLHFWASWCLPCRTEWPELVAFAGRYDSGEVVLLAVNSQEPVEVVRGFVGEDLPPFPVLLDGDGGVSRAYRVSALPTTFVVGPDGVIQQVVPGNLGAEGLMELVER